MKRKPMTPTRLRRALRAHERREAMVASEIQALSADAADASPEAMRRALSVIAERYEEAA